VDVDVVGAGVFSIALIMDFDALTQPFVFKAPLKKATTTGQTSPSALCGYGRRFTLLIPLRVE